MTERLDYNQVAPNGVKALGGVYGYVMQSGLPAELVPRTNKTAARMEPALLQSIDPVWLLYCEGANVMKNILRNDEPPQDLVLDAKVARSELRGRVTRFPR